VYSKPKRDALVVVMKEHGHTVVPVVVATEPEEKKPDNPNLPRWGIWPPSQLPTNPFNIWYHRQ